MDRGERGVVMGLIRLLPRPGAAQPAAPPVEDAPSDVAPLEEPLVEAPAVSEPVPEPALEAEPTDIVPMASSVVDRQEAAATSKAVATRVIVLANQKGGVAKTTTTLNLGVALREMGNSVLLVDLDPQGNLTMSQGLNPDVIERSMFDVLVHKLPISEVIETREVDLAVASIDLAGAELALSAMIGRERALEKSLAEVRYASATELLATYAGRATDLKPWLNEAEINRDRNLRLQYTAGTELNLDQGLRIYGEIIRFRNFPGELFSGSQALIEGLRQAIIKRK